MFGGEGNDFLVGGAGADSIDVSEGRGIIAYEVRLDGGDIVSGFDAAGADRDVISLDRLFDGLGVGTADRAGRIDVQKNGNTHTLRVDTTGNDSFDLVVATVNVIDGSILNVDQDSADVQYGSF